MDLAALKTRLFRALSWGATIAKGDVYADRLEAKFGPVHSQGGRGSAQHLLDLIEHAEKNPFKAPPSPFLEPESPVIPVEENLDESPVIPVDVEAVTEPAPVLPVAEVEELKAEPAVEAVVSEKPEAEEPKVEEPAVEEPKVETEEPKAEVKPEESKVEKKGRRR